MPKAVRRQDRLTIRLPFLSMLQYYLFHNNQLLLDADNIVPVSAPDGSEVMPFCLDDGVECRCAEVDRVPTDLHPIDLRSSYDVLPFTDYLRAGKAAELIYWHNNHRFCSHCGSPLQSQTVISKLCPKCGKEWWPQLSPAIIVLIHRGEEILLVRSRNFKGTHWGLVAGFVEFGESVEECVMREVNEETRLTIANLRYFGSQPWPYPQGLMLGFTAKYISGELKIQQSELKEGGWFSIHHLPEIPKPLSMARRLIDNYIATFKNHS